jgi:hypothetical protein
MKMRKHALALVVAVVAVAWVAAGGIAQAAFPDFSRCPTTAPDIAGCIHVKNTSGDLNIKGFNVPLGGSLEIRGGLTTSETGNRFVPATGTNGFFSTPVPVPGGLLGIDFWIPGNSVLAITELAGPSSGIQFDFETFSIRIPVKVRLVNLLLGMDCHIGSDSSPVVLNLITGTTNPPPPNTPISGRTGRFTVVSPTLLTVTGNVNVDNAFAVPGASRCGLGLGLINSLVNTKLRLPSAAGNNSIVVGNDVAIQVLE